MLSSGYYVGEVINVNPLEYSVEVRVHGSGNSRNNQTIIASPLAFHGGASGATVGVSLPEIGSIVMVVIPIGAASESAFIVGHIKEHSSRKELPKHITNIDPLSSTMSPRGYYRGSSTPDILPGDLVIESSGGSYVRVNAGSEARIGSFKSETSHRTVMGKGIVSSKADEYYVNSKLLDIELTEDSMLLSANVNDSEMRNAAKQSGSLENDLAINIGGQKAISIEYTGSKVPAIFSINKEGEIEIKGSKVTIDSSSKVKRPDGFEEIPDDYKLEVKGDTILKTQDYTLDTSGNTKISSTGAVEISSGSDMVTYCNGMFKQVVSGPSAILNAPNSLISGFNDGMVFQCDSGSAVTTVGSSIVPGIAKPQIRLEASSGGDIIIQSASSVGGFGVSGSVVLSSPIPLSTTGAGGLFNYGIVLNSPICMLGNLPGLELTPPYLPNIFLPPIPMSPINHDLLVKATPLLTLLGALGAALTASGPTTPAGIAFNAALAANLPLLTTKTVYGI